MPFLHDGTAYEIRRATIEDYEGDRYERLQRWLHEVDDFLAFTFDAAHVEMNRAAWLRTVKEQSDTRGIIIAAFLNGEIIGQADLGLNREANHKGRNTGGWGVAVKKAYHNQGVGYHLLIEIERIARDLGLHKLEAGVAAGNEPAKALYIRKLGYQVEGRRRDHLLLDSGEYADELVIGKLLD